jgi:hypothetical protein
MNMISHVLYFENKDEKNVAIKEAWNDFIFRDFVFLHPTLSYNKTKYGDAT